MKSEKIPKLGRKTKVTKERLELLKQAFMLGLNDTQACLQADIHPDTLRRYERKNPEFSLMKAVLREYPVKFATNVLYQGLKDKPELALKVLEKLDKKYKQTKDIKIEAKSFESVLNELNEKSVTTDQEEEGSNGKDMLTAEQNKPEPPGGG